MKRPKATGRLLSLGVTLAVAVVALVLYARFQLLLPPERLHSNDFKHLYLGARILALGQNPYDAQTMLEAARLEGLGGINPYVYLPFTAQTLFPLSCLDFQQAVRVWFCANHLFLVASLILMASCFKPGRRALAFFLLLGFSAFWYPLTRTLTAGQLNCALLLLLTLHCFLARQGRLQLSGFFLAFASLFKIAPGFVFVVLILQRRWRLLAWSSIWLAALLIASAAWCGPRLYLDSFPVLKQMRYGESTWAGLGMEFYRDPFNQSFNSFFHHALTKNPTAVPLVNLGPSAANKLTWLVSLMLLAGTGFVFAASPPRFLFRREDEAVTSNGAVASPTAADDLDLALAIMVMLLLPSLYWDHYAVMLLLPIAIIALHRPRPGEMAAMALGALAVGAPQGYFQSLYTGEFAGPFLFSMGLWGTLILLAVATRMRLRIARSIQRDAQTQSQTV